MPHAGVFGQEAAQLLGGHANARLVHAATLDAVVLGVDDDAQSARAKLLFERVGNLTGQALLDLQALGENIDQPGEHEIPTTRLAGR